MPSVRISCLISAACHVFRHTCGCWTRKTSTLVLYTMELPALWQIFLLGFHSISTSVITTVNIGQCWVLDCNVDVFYDSRGCVSRQFRLCVVCHCCCSPVVSCWVYGANHKACPHEGRKGLGRMWTKQRSAVWCYQQTAKTGRMYHQTFF